MKKIVLRSDTAQMGNERIASATLLKMVAGNSPNKALTVDEMRKRVHILDALESSSGDVLFLEDEDHRCLSDAIQGFPWSAANKALLQIIDDVLNAEVIPAAKLVEKGGKN